MNRLGPTAPPPLTIEFTREDAEALSITLNDVEDPDPVVVQLANIIDTYLNEG